MYLKLPRSDYTIDSFLEEISNNADQYFETGRERKWLKTYLFYAKEDWLKLFDKFNPEKNGELYYFAIPNTRDDTNRPTEYYATQFSSGLVIVFTSEKQEDYANTLLDHINRKRGITPMWINHESFTKIIQYVIRKYEGYIYFFIAKRHWSSEISSKFRGEYNRTIHYIAEDGNDAINEMEQFYGVIPTLVDFRIGKDSMRITNDGLFVVRSLNLTMFRMVIEMVNNIISEQKQIHKISTSIDSHLEQVSFGDKKMSIRQVESGRIVFTRPLSTLLIKKLFRESNERDLGKTGEKEGMDDFAFIDTTINDLNGFSFSATVIDRVKGSVFGLSGTRDQMVCVPMHRTTFESFIRFYKLVSESLDSTSSLGLFSDPIVAR